MAARRLYSAFRMSHIRLAHSSAVSIKNSNNIIVLKKKQTNIPVISPIIAQYKTLYSATSQLLKGSWHLFGLYVEKNNGADKLVTRAHISHYNRVKSDTSRFAVSFLVFLVPFLPKLVVKWNPNLISSVFIVDQYWDLKNQQLSATRSKLNAKLNDTLLTSITTLSDSETASKDNNFTKLSQKEQTRMKSNITLWSKLQKSNAIHSYQPIIQFQDLFLYLVTSPKTSDTLIKSCAKYLSFPFASVLTKEQFLMWADWMLKDDKLLSETPLNNLLDYEVVEALEVRGFKGMEKMTSKQMRKLLKSHMDFTRSLVQRVLVLRGGKLGAEAEITSLTPHEVMAVGVSVLVARVFNVLE
ncbi:hypothetical protein HK098_004367 [Nowakowskiella sp. JEL0407]|nr:hypothetical protein HK098_004367 [Nowakowskiella sp. JEL0407]